MRLLIAGWQGQIARALVEQAPAAHDITALAVGRPALDICEAATITRAMTDFRPDVIINTAAYTAVDQAETEPDAAFALNRDGARLLALAAAKKGAVLIHLSTDYVFDGAKAGPYVEDDTTAPLNVYGHSKLASEAVVRAATPRHIIVRTSWVHSAMRRNFVRSMLEKAHAGEAVRVVDDQIGAPTYAPHLAEALLTIARRALAGGDGVWGTYHAAGAGYVSWCGLAREVFRVSALHGGPSASVTAIKSADYPTRAARPLNARLDCGKLATGLGTRLPSWQSGVEACVTRLLSDPAPSKR